MFFFWGGGLCAGAKQAGESLSVARMTPIRSTASLLNTGNSATLSIHCLLAHTHTHTHTHTHSPAKA